MGYASFERAYITGLPSTLLNVPLAQLIKCQDRASAGNSRETVTN